MDGLDDPDSIMRRQAPVASRPAWDAATPGRRRRFPAGECLYWQGEAQPPGFAIESGWIALEIDTGGETPCIVDFVLPGEFLAAPPRALAACGHTARCLTDVVARSATRREIAEFAEATGDLAGYLDQCLACRIFRTQDHMANIVTRDSYGRVAHLLYGLYCRNTHDGGLGGDRDSVACPLRLRHIGAITAMSMVHVSRTLGRLANDGVVTLKSSRLTVVDRPLLEGAAGPFDASLADPVVQQGRRARR